MGLGVLTRFQNARCVKSKGKEELVQKAWCEQRFTKWTTKLQSVPAVPWAGRDVLLGASLQNLHQDFWRKHQFCWESGVWSRLTRCSSRQMLLTLVNTVFLTPSPLLPKWFCFLALAPSSSSSSLPLALWTSTRKTHQGLLCCSLTPSTSFPLWGLSFAVLLPGTHLL